MSKRCFGVDVGGTTVKLALVSGEGHLEDMWEIPTRTQDGGIRILPDIRDALKGKMKEKNLKKEDIQGIGVGIPGPILADGSVDGCVNLGWGRKAVVRELSEEMDGMPVAVANDANVAALGEQWQGSGKGHDSMVMITLGTGVGGGIILDGKILGGFTGSAGEVGHICCVAEEDLDEKNCNCGNRGCLEQVASAPGTVRLAKKVLRETDRPSLLRGKNDFTAKDVYDAAKAGDEAAAYVIGRVADYLAKALAGITAVVDPEIIVVGGGVSKAGTFLTDQIKERYSAYAFGQLKAIPIVPASLGNKAGVMGASRLILSVSGEGRR